MLHSLRSLSMHSSHVLTCLPFDSVQSALVDVCEAMRRRSLAEPAIEKVKALSDKATAYEDLAHCVYIHQGAKAASGGNAAQRNARP